MDNLIIENNTCEIDRYSGKTTVDVSTEAVLRYMLIASLILLFPFSAILNGFLMVLIAAVKELHQTAYFLALQVVIIDLVITIIATPISVVSAIINEWKMGPEFCGISLFVLHLLRHSRYWMMFVLVTDRFCSVFFPFSYKRYKLASTILLSILAWTVSFLFAILPVTLDCEEFSRVTWYCTGGNGCKNPQGCQWSRITTTLITNIIGSVLPLIMYIVLFVKAKRIQKSIRKMISTTSKEKQNRNREWQVNLTFFWLFLALFGITIIPFLFFVFGISLISSLGIKTPPEYMVTTIVFRSLYNILPVIDAISIMRNADIHKAAKKIITSKFVRLQLNTTSNMSSDHSTAIKSTSVTPVQLHDC